MESAEAESRRESASWLCLDEENLCIIRSKLQEKSVGLHFGFIPPLPVWRLHLNANESLSRQTSWIHWCHCVLLDPISLKTRRRGAAEIRLLPRNKINPFVQLEEAKQSGLGQELLIQAAEFILMDWSRLQSTAKSAGFKTNKTKWHRVRGKYAKRVQRSGCTCKITLGKPTSNSLKAGFFWCEVIQSECLMFSRQFCSG